MAQLSVLTVLRAIGFGLLAGRERREDALQAGAEHALHGAGEEDHQRLDDDDHLLA